MDKKRIIKRIMARRLINIVLLVASAVLPITAQPLSDKTEKLNLLFQEFRYQEVIQQAEELLGQNVQMPLPEKCDVLRLIALSYYARQDMNGALRNFAEIVKRDENYRLDPLDHSPKILAFFEEIRRQMQSVRPPAASLKQDSLLMSRAIMRQDTVAQAAYQRMALSFIVPGSGQMACAEKTKGWLLLGGNIALLGGFIYFSAETNRLEDHYLQTTSPNTIAAAYHDYNQAYQKQTMFLTGFLTIWIYTQIDFLFIKPPAYQTSRLSWQPGMDRSGRTSLTIFYRF